MPEQPELNRPDDLTPDGLPLPDPFPEYIACPHCGEPEVEIWCYQAEAQCHQCGQWIKHEQPPCVGSSPICREAVKRQGEENKKRSSTD